MAGIVCDAGDGGVADARGDARISDASDALGVGVFGGGDGIIGGDCESGITWLTHTDAHTHNESTFGRFQVFSCGLQSSERHD